MIHPELATIGYALSVRQPWAWCIIHGGKHLENRTQGALKHMSKSVTHIAIHASTGMTREEYEDVLDHPGLRERGLELPRPDELTRGAIIGHVRIVDRISNSNSPWWCGPRALVLADPVAIDPIACRGALGFFDWRNGLQQVKTWNREAGPAQLEEPKPWMKAWPRAHHLKREAPEAMGLLPDINPVERVISREAGLFDVPTKE